MARLAVPTNLGEESSLSLGSLGLEQKIRFAVPLRMKGGREVQNHLALSMT